MARLKPGDKAPPFKLQNENQEWVALADLLENGPLMLIFYPGDFTPVCTKQLCSYRDAWSDFQGAGIQMVGISPDEPGEHKRFRTQFGFSFPLLSDPGKAVFSNYGVLVPLIGAAGRGTYILDRDGTILYREVELTPLTHQKPQELIGVLDDLRRSGRI